MSNNNNIPTADSPMCFYLMTEEDVYTKMKALVNDTVLMEKFGIYKPEPAFFGFPLEDDEENVIVTYDDSDEPELYNIAVNSRNFDKIWAVMSPKDEEKWINLFDFYNSIAFPE